MTVSYTHLRYLYTTIGYDCHCVSAITGEGFDFIDSFIANKITLLSGHSGVGKSTIIDRILPNAHVKIGAVSTSHHKGMHTTTFSEMYPLPQGGCIIDTPGIKGFGTIDFNPIDKCRGKRLACTIEDRHRYHRYAFDKKQDFITPTQHTRQ